MLAINHTMVRNKRKFSVNFQFANQCIDYLRIIHKRKCCGVNRSSANGTFRPFLCRRANDTTPNEDVVSRQTIVYWLLIALWCAACDAVRVARTEPVCTRAFAAIRLIAPVLIVAARRIFNGCEPGLFGRSAVALAAVVPAAHGSLQMTKFVKQTSSGPLFSSGIGWLRKCSNMSKILGNHKCCTRQLPSGLSERRKCWKRRIHHPINTTILKHWPMEFQENQFLTVLSVVKICPTQFMVCIFS